VKRETPKTGLTRSCRGHSILPINKFLKPGGTLERCSQVILGNMNIATWERL